MERGIAFLPIIALAIIGLVAGTTALSTLNERPGSALYGVQRAAEAVPTNLLNYLSANYSGGLVEKRTAEAKDILRADGKEAAKAFARREGVLDQKLFLDIEQYVPLIDGVKENLITVFRHTTPPEVSQGREIALFNGERVRVTGTELVVEAGETRLPGKELAFTLLYEGDTAEYSGRYYRLMSGGNDPLAVSDNGSRITRNADCGNGLCVSLSNPAIPADYGWAFLKISEPKTESKVTAYLVRDGEYLGADTVFLAPPSAILFGRYNASLAYDGKVTRIKVLPIDEGRLYVKVCNAADYRAKGKNCGDGLKKVTIRLSDNGAAPSTLYHVEMSRLEKGDKKGSIVCAWEACANGSEYIALFSEDGSRWSWDAAVLTETEGGVDGGLVKGYFNVAKWPPARYLEFLLPVGRYGLNQDANNPGRFYAILDTANAMASLEYELLSRKYVEGVNIYVDIYGLRAAGTDAYKGIENDITAIFGDFYRMVGRLPGTSRVKVRVSANPFDYSPGSAGWYSGEWEGITLTSWAWERGSLCHELAHGLQGETGNVNLGSVFGEGFAQNLCVHLGYAQPSVGLAEGFDFRGCIERFDEPHALGNCIFENARARGLYSDSFFRKLLDFPCGLKAYADLRTGKGRNMWYYVLSTAAGRKIDDFPHTGEIDYCAAAGRNASVSSPREAGPDAPFTIGVGEIVGIRQLGDYVALSGIGERATKTFVAAQGNVLEINGRRVVLKAIGRLQGNNSWGLVFEIGGAVKTVYWDGSATAYPLEAGLQVAVLAVVREDSGRFVAELRLEMDRAANGIGFIYVTPPKGNDSSEIRYASLLPGQSLDVHGGEYRLELLVVDRDRNEAEIALRPRSRALELLVERCLAAPPRLQLLNIGASPAYGAAGRVLDASLNSVGILRIPAIGAGERAIVWIENFTGSTYVGNEYYLEIPGTPVAKFAC